jgi:exodeoxyribonuclease VII large subunit
MPSSSSGFLPTVTQPDRVYTVTEINQLVRQILEDTVGTVWVEGEISNFVQASSGHRYFSLKDEGASLKCAMWKGTGRLDFKPADGLRIRAYGRMSTYPPRGDYQLIVTQMLAIGIGPLEVAFQKLKDRLLREGLFAEERKRPLPRFPESVGIVTSPTGAAIEDMRRTVAARHPALRLVLHPARVQGEGAAEEIVAGIESLNARPDIDVIIVGRGGGSLEDLWPFNEEIVARAIFESRLPIISAVGHEVDFTITDFVADLRAATPTAAAQLVTEDWVLVREQMPHLRERLMRAVTSLLQEKSQHTERLRQSHALRRPADLFLQWMQRVDEMGLRLTRGIQQEERRQTQRLEALSGRLTALSPEHVLQRGYSITRRVGDPKALREAAGAKPGDQLETRLAAGVIISRTEESRP